MLKFAIFFFLVAVVAACFGFSGLAGAAAGIAQFLFVICLVLFIGTLLIGRRLLR
jgi:uncharacterized membrane protein YtjA (UPF0391 family)